MASELQIIITAKDGSQLVIRGTVNNLDALDATAKKVSQSFGKSVTDARGFADKLGDAYSRNAARFDEFANKIDNAGTKARMGLSAIAQLSDMAGLKISGMVMSAAQAADAVGDLASAVKGLGLAGGAVGVLVTAFVVLDAAMQAHNRAIAEGILKNDEWARSMERAAKGNSLATEKLREMATALAQAKTGWSWDIGDIVNRWMQFDTVGRGAAQAMHMLGIEARDLNPALETSAQKAARLKEELNNMAFAAGAAGAALRTLGGDAGAAVGRTAEEIRIAGILAQRSTVDVHDLRSGVAEFGETTQIVTTEVLDWNAQMRMMGATGNIAAGGIDQARIAAERMLSVIRGAVEQSLTPTSVTDTDMQAAAMGKYVDKWDEWRRRLEAAMSGTNLAAQSWGAQFSAQLAEVQQRTGMSLEQIDAAFKDFSLFADKRNLQLINWDAVVGDTQDAINAIIGKYNVVTAGVEAYLASDAAKEQLPQLKLALGLDVSASEQDVKDALTGALGGVSGTAEKATVKTSLTLDTTGAKGQASEVQKLIAAIPASTAGSTVITKVNLDAALAMTAASNLKDAIGKIPASEKGTTVTTIVDVVKASTFDENLQDILDDLAKIPTEIDVTVNVHSGGGTNGGGTNGGGTNTATNTNSNIERARVTPREFYRASSVLAREGFRLAEAGGPGAGGAGGAQGTGSVLFPEAPRRARNTSTSPGSYTVPTGASGGDVIFDFRGAQFYGSGPEVAGLLERTLTGTLLSALDQSAVDASNLAQLLGQ